jgi:hypothetical protein
MVVPADYTAIVTAGFGSFTGAVEFDPAQATLTGPHATFAFSAVATASALTAEQVRALGLRDPQAEPGMRPTDGYEFLVLRTADSGGQWAGQASPPRTAVTIRSGDRSWPLTGIVSAGHTVVLSVPKAAPTTLVLEDEGRAQTLDLRTGRRGADAIGLYYPTRTADVDGDLGCWAQVSGVTVPSAMQGNLVSLTGSTRRAGLYPFYGKHGWARPGRAWLEVGLSPGSTLGDVVLTVNAAASFTLTVPGGKPVAPLAGTGDFKLTNTIGTSPDPVALVFDVPDTFRSGTITFAPRGTVNVVVNGQDKTGTLRPSTSAKPFTIRLPG